MSGMVREDRAFSNIGIATWRTEYIYGNIIVNFIMEPSWLHTSTMTEIIPWEYKVTTGSVRLSRVFLWNLSKYVAKLEAMIVCDKHDSSQWTFSVYQSILTIVQAFVGNGGPETWISYRKTVTTESSCKQNQRKTETIGHPWSWACIMSVGRVLTIFIIVHDACICAESSVTKR